MGNSLIQGYLESVADDSSEGPVTSLSTAIHSDRHRALLAHFRLCEGGADDGDRALLRAAAALDAHRAVLLRRVTDAFAREKIDCLVLKGAAVAHASYPAAYLRPRNDDDLWVRESDFAAACAVLEAGGYAAQVEVVSPQITRQRHFVARNPGAHEVDLHWWPVNPSAFDALPDFDACLAEAVALPGIGPHARAPGPVDALLLTCAHRVAHHTETEDAMWHCDVHYLAARLTPDEWGRFEARAQRARVARLAGAALQYVVTHLGTDVPAGVVARLQRVEGEASARYLRPLGPLGALWLELRARPGLRGRLRLLAHHVLPPREYVAARYGYDGVVFLPFLYAHRAVRGLVHWTVELMFRLGR